MFFNVRFFSDAYTSGYLGTDPATPPLPSFVKIPNKPHSQHVSI